MADSVRELDSRLERLDTMLEESKVELCGKEQRKSEVYRDKNTLVEVTIHRRAQATKASTRSLERSREFMKPTVASQGRSSAPEAGVVEGRGGGRGVKEVMKELRGLLHGPGGEEVRCFLQELEVGKPKQSKTCASPTKVQAQAEMTKKVERLNREVERWRGEAARAREEQGVATRQAELRRQEQESLEVQVIDLKKIVSRLTRNNSELLGIVSEKINYEEKIGGLEARGATLASQLESERRRACEAERRLASADREAAGLRKVTAELRAGLQHGLEGLDGRPASGGGRRGDKTRQILGASVLDKEDSEDSAMEDPNTESLGTARVPHTPPTRQKSRPGSVALQTQLQQQQLQQSQQQQLQQQQQHQFVAPAPVLQPQQFHAPASTQQQFQQYQQQHVTAVATSQFHPGLSRLTNTNYAPPASQHQAPTVPQPTSSQPSSWLPPPQQLPPPRSQSRSSTLRDTTTTPTFQPKDVSFQPAVLDLSETQSITEVDGVAPIPRHPETFGPPPTSKTSSLETKVTGFLARLHQDSVNLSLEVPQVKSFQGPSMHLSLSGSELEGSVDTTLSEGKFLRGLEDSIEVTQQVESTQEF